MRAGARAARLLLEQAQAALQQEGRESAALLMGELRVVAEAGPIHRLWVASRPEDDRALAVAR